jgi:hypothetical protein
MGRTEETTDRPERRLSLLWKVVLFLFAGAFLAVVVFVVLFVRVRTDQEPRGPLVQNDTAELVDVYFVDLDGTEYQGTFLRPGETKELFGLCGSGLVARHRSGNLIARRGPFGPSPKDECHDPIWVIGN